MNPDVKAARRSLWQAAADLVRADLEATTELRWPLLIEDSQFDEDDFTFNHGSSGHDLYPLPTDADMARAVTEGEAPAGTTIMGVLAMCLADRVSEDVMEELERPWPSCNVHRRPLDPIPVGPTGTWQCSKDPAHAAPIGGLAGMVDAAGVARLHVTGLYVLVGVIVVVAVLGVVRKRRDGVLRPVTAGARRPRTA